MAKHQLIFLGIFFGCAIIHTIIDDYTTFCPSHLEKKRFPIEYKSIVIDKFNDKKDHNFPKIKLKNHNNDTIIYPLSYAEENEYDRNGHLGLWYKVEIGDSIFKPKNSLDIILKKGFYDSTFFKYNCNPKNISNW